MAFKSDSVRTEIVVREFEYQMSVLSTGRGALASVLGIGTSVVLGLAALAFQNGRPLPLAWVIVVGTVLLIAGFVLGIVVFILSRAAVKPPDMDHEALARSGSTAEDITENYLRSLSTVVTRNRSTMLWFDIGVVVTVFCLAASAGWWLVSLAKPCAFGCQHASATTTTTTMYAPRSRPGMVGLAQNPSVVPTRLVARSVPVVTRTMQFTLGNILLE